MREDVFIYNEKNTCGIREEFVNGFYVKVNAVHVVAFKFSCTN